MIYLIKKLFTDASSTDIHSQNFKIMMEKYYLSDPVLNPLTPPKRPPIRNVYCIYGTNIETEISYEYEVVSGYPFRLIETVYEGPDGQIYSKPATFSKKNAWEIYR